MFTKYCWPEGSGGELATYLWLSLLSNDFDIIVVSGTHPSKTNFNFYLYKYVYLKGLEQNNKLLDFLNITFLSKIVRKVIEDADVIYVYTPLSAAILAKKICPNKRVIVHLHNYQPFSYSSVIFSKELNQDNDFERSIKIELLENKRISKALLSGLLTPSNIINKISLSYADEIICVSNGQAQIIKNIFKEISKKVTVLYNPLPNYDQNYRCPSDKPSLLYLGGDSYIKGFNLLLMAISKLRLQYYANNLQIICAGSFSNLTPFSPLAQIIGRVKHNVVHDLFQTSWGLLAPSIVEEPLSFAVVEAMANGVIPIVPKVGGNPEIVQGTFAEKMLFTPLDVDDFVDKINNLLSFSKEDLIDISAKLKLQTKRKFNTELSENCLKNMFVN